MTYATLSRRITDRHTRARCKGRKTTDYWVKTNHIDPWVLSEYIQHRSPKSRVMLDLSTTNLKIVMLTE